MKLLVASILLLFISQVLAAYTIIRSKPNNVTFRYADGIEGESDLHKCGVFEACNIVHNRFWSSNLIERLCLCANRKECPWQWSQVENSSMILNNRSVMKFCTPIDDTDACIHTKVAAIIYGRGDPSNSYLIPYNATITCNCPASHYWRLQKYTYKRDGTILQEFKCVKKRMCEANEFCGNVRADLYSVYYKCTCPENHLCIFKNRTQENVQELLYVGPAYKAYCYAFGTIKTNHHQQ